MMGAKNVNATTKTCFFCKVVLVAAGMTRNLRKAGSSYEDLLQTS